MALSKQHIIEKYQKLQKAGAIKEHKQIIIHLKFEKSINDLALAKGLFKVSNNTQEKFSYRTFYDWVIISCYYSIFHCTQALLGTKQIKIRARMHAATLIAFAHNFIINDELELQLFNIYKDSEQKASELMQIIEDEKHKRALFQYHRLSRYNKEPALESLQNAEKFVSTIKQVLQKDNYI